MLFFAVLFGVALARIWATAAAPMVRVVDEAGAALLRHHRPGHEAWRRWARSAPWRSRSASFGAGTLLNLDLPYGLLLRDLRHLRVRGARHHDAAGLRPQRCSSLLAYLKEEFFIVLGTSSSEAALPTLIEKLEANRLPAARWSASPCRLGYAFNLDGTSDLLHDGDHLHRAGAQHQSQRGASICGIVAVLLLTSKGAAAVTGGGFITLAATLTTMQGKIPVESIVLVLAVDRFMSEARAITNLFGNAVATIVVTKWEGQLDMKLARTVLARREQPQIAAPA